MKIIIFIIGFGIYYLDQNNFIKSVNFDVISNSLDKQDGNSVVRGFRILRSHNFFQNLAQNKQLVIWADCGTHFKNKTVLGYLFKELKDQNVHGIISKYLNWLIVKSYQFLNSIKSI